MKHFASLFLGIIALTSVTQAQNILPQANLSLTPSVVRVGELVQYDASGSRNSQGEARNLEYRFQLTKSGPWTNFTANPKGEFKALETGYNLIRVEVRDSTTNATQRTFRQYDVRAERRPNPPRLDRSRDQKPTTRSWRF